MSLTSFARPLLLCLVTSLGCTSPASPEPALPRPAAASAANLDPAAARQRPAQAETAPADALADWPTGAADKDVDSEADTEVRTEAETKADIEVDTKTDTEVDTRVSTETEVTAEPQPPAAALPVAATPEPVVRVVAADGSGDHRTITEAIAAAGYLDEIRILPGTYTEALLIDRRISLSRGAGQGAVVIDGGDFPALTLDRVTMVEVSELVLKGGAESLAAVVVQQGQLKLTSCRLDSSPHSAAAGAANDGAQLVLVDCIVRAGAGTALAMVGESKGALESCRFSWGPGNPTPFIDPEALAVVTMKNCVFGRQPIDGPFLVSANLLSMLPENGMPTLSVQPDRTRWPHWATQNETHFESLALAADRAPAGSHILVVPGIYLKRVGIVRSLSISSTGGSGDVKLVGDGASALWINADSKVTLQGLSLSASMGDGTPAVQINGGTVSLIDCRIDNDEGHGLIVTDNYAPSRVSLSGCRIFSMKKAVYATGKTSSLKLRDCLLAGDSIALFLMDGATAAITNSTFDTERYAVELWGPDTSARLEGCTILRASQVLAFKEGAVRSQVQTAGLIVK